MLTPSSEQARGPITLGTIQDYAERHGMENWGAQLLPSKGIELEYPNGWNVETDNGTYWVWISRL